MNYANDSQVGGNHYKTVYEHWDYVIANNLNYFEGQITKYVTRCRVKNGVQDLEKAKHFLEKYIECYKDIANPKGSLRRYEDLNPAFVSDNIFLCEGGYGNGSLLFTHRATKKQFKASSLEDAHRQWDSVFNKIVDEGEPWPRPEEPTPNYVKQD